MTITSPSLVTISSLICGCSGWSLPSRFTPPAGAVPVRHGWTPRRYGDSHQTAIMYFYILVFQFFAVSEHVCHYNRPMIPFKRIGRVIQHPRRCHKKRIFWWYSKKVVFLIFYYLKVIVYVINRDAFRINYKYFWWPKQEKYWDFNKLIFKTFYNYKILLNTLGWDGYPTSE